MLKKLLLSMMLLASLDLLTTVAIIELSNGAFNEKNELFYSAAAALGIDLVWSIALGKVTQLLILSVAYSQKKINEWWMVGVAPLTIIYLLVVVNNFQNLWVVLHATN